MIDFYKWLENKHFLIKEMPMQLNLVGNWSDLATKAKLGQPNNFFDVKSTRMLDSSKAKTKIVQKLKNVPYDFNVYFVPSKYKHYTGKVSSRSEYKDLYQDLEIAPEQAPILPNKINLFVASWSQEPPTAWMIIHRFAHALNDLTNEVYRLVEKYSKNMGIISDYRLVNDFGTMRSARMNTLGAADEPSHELITQFIMNGKITFKSGRTEQQNQQLEELATNLNELIKIGLEEAKKHTYIIF